MLLTLTTTFPPATDLGHLLRKHPGRVHSAERSFGRAHVFYPVGMDVSHRALEIAHARLNLERMPPLQRERVRLFQGSLM